MVEKGRLPAKKVRIVDILNGKFFFGSKEDKKPSYVITPFGQKISRVNVLATVTEKFVDDASKFSTLTLDDGTGAIRAKAFGEGCKILEKVEVGDLVIAIGKLKEYNGEVYINSEIVRKVENFNMENLRKLEILNELIEQKRKVEEIKGMVKHARIEEVKEYASKKFGMSEDVVDFLLEDLLKESVDYKQKILDLIDELDEGEGAEIAKIFEVCNLPENVIELTIDELLNAGYLYEPKVGFLKRIKTVKKVEK